MSAVYGARWISTRIIYLSGKKVLQYRDHIHNTSFSSKLTNGSNKVECYIILGFKDLPGTNALACLPHLRVTKQMMFSERDS